MQYSHLCFPFVSTVRLTRYRGSFPESKEART